MFENPLYRRCEEGAVEMLSNLNNIRRRQSQLPRALYLQALRQHGPMAATARDDAKKAALAATIGSGNCIGAARSQDQLRKPHL
mmetsp:Transcript_93805/g.165416  ORF Transcript_93805/g.165416 Transcript_93805/m.165416 type:complete len:84 (-) Transcript_93805:1870-2121(-)